MRYNLDNIIARPKGKVIFRDGTTKIKLFDESYSKANVLNEALNQARVEEETNLPIPKLLEVTKIDEKWALIDEYVDGKSLDILIKENPNKIDEYIEFFVNVQLTIQSNSVVLLTSIKDKFKRKINFAKNIDNNIKYELLQRLEGMKNHSKLCHGDLSPANIIIDNSGNYHIIDWAHVTQGNASADAARTFLLFNLNHQETLAEKYLDKFSEMSGIAIKNIQRWIPIVAATQKTKMIEEEQELLNKWINVTDYE